MCPMSVQKAEDVRPSRAVVAVYKYYKYFSKVMDLIQMTRLMYESNIFRMI